MKKNFLFMTLAAIVMTAMVFTGCKKDPDPVKVSSVAFKSTPSASLEVGGTYTFEAVVLPENAENKSVTWDSSNKSVATVSGGVVTALAAGTTTISATAADGSGKKAEFALTVVDAPVTPTVAITFAEWLSTSAVNEIKYSEALDAEGKPAKELKVFVVATDNIEKITLKLTTDVELINQALTGMEIADGFELGTLPAPIAGALAGFFGEGLPTGADVVGKDRVTLDFSAILALIVGEDTRILGGVDQFDIEINAEDANGLKAETKTLKLKFIDDVTEWGKIEGDGFDITEEQVIKASEAAGASRKIDITSLTGIANLLVDIDNPTLDPMLALAGLDGEFDIANPDAALTGSLAMLAGMGLALPSGDAVKDKTELTLDMATNFIARLVQLGDGTTDIKLTVKDAAGHAANETLKITIVDDLKLTITGDGLGEEPLAIEKSKAMGETPTPVVVDIAAPQGIENFKVLISTSSAAFTGGLAEMHLDQEFDIANLSEELAAILASPAVGLIDPDSPIKGATELQFDITDFIPMIFGVRAVAEESGDCTADFKLTITDGKGKTETKTIKLSLIDDTTAVAEQ